MKIDFESLEANDNPFVIFRGIVGSHAYGTANAQSDVDTRGVFVVPSMEYVRLLPPPKQVSDAKNMMHLTRLLFSGESIVVNGHPIVRFTGEKLETLLAIRRGEWEFDRIIAHAEAIQARIIDGKGRLPADCDVERVSDLVAEVMKEAGVS